MSNTMRQLSQRQQVRSIQERLEQIEGGIASVVTGINGGFQQFNQRLGEALRILGALTEMMGAEAVDAKVAEIDARNKKAALERAQAALKEGIEKGRVVPVAAVAEHCLIVGREVAADGKTESVQVSFETLRPEVREKIQGLAAGSTVDLTEGVKFEIEAVYEVLEQDPQAPEQNEAPPPAPAPTEEPAVAPQA